jgi:hypothetical protein
MKLFPIYKLRKLFLKRTVTKILSLV